MTATSTIAAWKRRLADTTALARSGVAIASVAAVGSLAGTSLAFAQNPIDSKDYLIEGTSEAVSTNRGFQDDLIVGLDLPGAMLTISNGAEAVVQNRAIIAGNSGGQGTVVVSGPGSALHVVRTNSVLGNEIYIGGGGNGYSATHIYGGHGTLRLEDGGTADAKKVYLGSGQKAYGTLVVTGADSELSADTFVSETGLGSPALSTITVENEGSINTIESSIGANTLITGAGSQWLNSGAVDTSADITVANGGKLTASTLDVGGSENNVVITGQGSSVVVAGEMDIGDVSTANVSVANGASLSVGGPLVIAGDTNAFDEGFGNLTIGGNVDMSDFRDIPSALAAEAAGYVNPDAVIAFGHGDGHLNFNHTNSGYVFANTLTGDGTINSFSGETILTGDLSKFRALDYWITSGGVNVSGGSRLVIDTDMGTDASKDNDTSPDITRMMVQNGTLIVNGETGHVHTDFLGTQTYTSRVSVWGPAENQAAISGAPNGFGKLGGIGTVGYTEIGGGAIIAPGDSAIGTEIGTLTVKGGLKLYNGSIYQVDIAGNGTGDKIVVEGPAGGAGGTVTIGTGVNVEVSALDAATSYQTGQTYTILTATGGITGTFAQAVSKSAFLTTTLNQQANQVDLMIAVNGSPTNPTLPADPTVPADPSDPTNPMDPLAPGVPTVPVVQGPSTGLFDSVAETANQRDTAVALNTLEQQGQSLALYNRILMLSADEARDAFDQLSGEGQASAQTALITESHFLRDAAAGRIRQAFGGVAAADVPILGYGEESKKGADPMLALDHEARHSADPMSVVTAPTIGLWGHAFGAWGEIDSDGNAGKLNHSTGGLIAGIDGEIAGNWRLGALAGYSHSAFDSRSYEGSSDNFHLGLYGGSQWGAVSFRTGVDYTWHQLDSTRTVVFPGFSDRLTADYDAGSFQAFGELGYRIDTQRAAFEPFANLAHVSLHTDGFTERGGAAALTTASDSTNTTFTTLGLRSSMDLNLGAQGATLSAMIGWRHAFGDTDPSQRAVFAGSDAFSVLGAPIDEDTAAAELGLDVKLTDAATLGVSYVGEFGSHAITNGVDAKLGVKF